MIPLTLASIENPNIEIDTDDLAYIAFTSGSTGLPKGVMGRHGPLTLFTSWALEKFGLNERDRFCVLSGLAHDPLHRDIFTPLQLGGLMCIPDPKDLEAPQRLRAWMKLQAISVANLTRQDGLDFLKVAGQANIRTHTTEFPLARANEALAQLREGKLVGAAVLRP